jgi:uncharacterized protein YjeT (DUF2065 family)
MLAVGIGIQSAPDRFRAIFDDLERVPGLSYLFGITAFAIGTAILIPHHILYDPLSIVVTVIAVLAAIEGLLLLAAPQVMFAIGRPFMASIRLWGIVSMVLGLVLFLCGFTGRADALP